MSLENVCAQGVAQLRHDRCCLKAPPRHVADDEPDAPVIDLEDVVPVPADLDAGATGYEARGELHTRYLGKPLGNEAPLQYICSPSIGDVADRTGHEHALVRRKGAETDLHGKLGAIPAPTVEVETRAHRAGV